MPPLSSKEAPPLAHIGDMMPLSDFNLKEWKRGNLKEKMRIGALSWAEVTTSF